MHGYMHVYVCTFTYIHMNMQLKERLDLEGYFPIYWVVVMEYVICVRLCMARNTCVVYVCS